MSLQPFQVGLDLVGAGLLSGACARAGLLTTGGAAAATFVGGTCLAFGGWPAAGALLTFFFTSTLLGRWRRRKKESLGFEKGGRRDAYQVLANGGAAAICLILSALLPGDHAVFRIGFLAALAEANADTWATEIGAASGAVPRLITTLRAAPAGMSGAISLPGTLAALAGSVLIALFGFVFVGTADLFQNNSFMVITVSLSGVFGAMIDSLLGATVQAQFLPADAEGEQLMTERRRPGNRLARGIMWIGNDAVNFVAAATAVLIALLLSDIHV